MSVDIILVSRAVPIVSIGKISKMPTISSGLIREFDRTNIIKFLKIFDIYADYASLPGKARLAIFLSYCIPALKQEVTILDGYKADSWPLFCTSLKKEYRLYDSEDKYATLESLVTLS
jgi:hypothetical protein